MDEQQVEKTEYENLQDQAKEYGIAANQSADNLKAAIEAKLAEKGPTGISRKDANDIEARVRFAEETRDTIRREREIITERAGLIAESESLCIPIDLPETPTELELARARTKLGLQKKEFRPSPETVAIEASKKRYYVFINRIQDDASHSTNPGGKYMINLIPDQVHVLSEWHVKYFKQHSIEPVYDRVKTGVVPGPGTEGQAVEECKRVANKPRWAFEDLGEAPQEAEFGLVTDAKILKELTATV